jgi:acylglycerol lipase
MMREMTTDRHALGGQTFLLRGWPSKTKSRTLLAIHHGLGEHSGRYESFARHLVDLPVHLWSYDLRGHGESTGKRGHADGLPQLADDFEALLPVMMERAQADQVIVLGHSLGAAAMGWYLTSRTAAGRALPGHVAAAVLSAPAVKVPNTLGVRARKLAGRALSRVAPSLTLPSGLDSEYISSDPSEVARYRQDPLIHDRLSVRLGLSILDHGPQIVQRAGQVQISLLMWHGLEDGIVDVAGSRELFAAWGATDKAFVELPGYRHESHHEKPNRTAHLFERIRAWLQPRVQGVS